ncbi:MAG: hypothetical protein ISS63_06570 [Desulfobacteraceae bacterium]|nr:hypothetical protein [Desulfobacteraceae bacterium]
MGILSFSEWNGTEGPRHFIRDYFEYDSVNTAISKDRLEIRNPGGLYGGLTIKQIRTRMVSQRRNELIADIFHRGHFVERWGRGIRLILSKEPTAEFEEIGLTIHNNSQFLNS